jgi:ABC-type sugar transport system permease subunit
MTGTELSAISHRRSPRRIRGLHWYLYVLPLIALILAVFCYPLVQVIRLSFMAGNPAHLTYVGLSNYRSVFTDQVFWTSVRNNFMLFLAVPVMIVLSLIPAILLFEGVFGWKVYRFIAFLPYVMSATVVGITFSFLYQYNGVLNTLLRSAGLRVLALDWLGDSHLVVLSIASVIVWQQIGFGTIIFLAQLMSIPLETLEAAELDGVGWWRKQWSIVVPQLRGVIEFFAITELINMLSWVFNYVYVITAGGPGNSSSVMELYIWRNAFYFRSFGMASAVATVLLIFTGLLILAYFRMQKRRTEAMAGSP